MGEKKKFYLTKEGLKKIERDYENLKKIRLAKTKGEAPALFESDDLNPEYLSFREDLNSLELKMAELENILKNAKLIKLPPKNRRNAVNLGARVVVEIDGEIDEFKIVGTAEADPSNKKISDESPIGKALLGKKIGETAVIKTPIVNHSCKIKKITYKR